MKTQQLDLAARYQPEHSSEYPKQHTQAMPAGKEHRRDCAAPRSSPLPSAGEIDAALERKYGAPQYREI